MNLRRLRFEGWFGVKIKSVVICDETGEISDEVQRSYL